MKIKFFLAFCALASSTWSMSAPTHISSVCTKVYEIPIVRPIPPPVIMNYGVPKLTEGDRIVSRNHAIGTTLHIIEHGETGFQLRELQKTGEVRSMLSVKTDGTISYLNLEKGYQNKYSISPLLAEEILISLKSKLDNGGWDVTFAGVKTREALEKVLGRWFQDKTESSQEWALSKRLPVPLSTIKSALAVQHDHAFGSDHFTFFPLGQGLLKERFDKSGNRKEAVLLLPNGQVLRSEKEGPQIIAHIPEDIAQGLIGYSYHHSALGGWALQRAFTDFSKFVLASAPELFPEELVRLRGHFAVEQDDGSIARIPFDNTPKEFDLKKGMDQN